MKRCQGRKYGEGSEGLRNMGREEPYGKTGRGSLTRKGGRRSIRGKGSLNGRKREKFCPRKKEPERRVGGE